MTEREQRTDMSRGEFLRIASRLGGLVLAAPLIQACQRATEFEPTRLAGPMPMPPDVSTPTTTGSPTPVTTVQGTAYATDAPTATLTSTYTPTSTHAPTASPSATPAPTSTPTKVATATLGPSPTPAPGATMVALVKTDDRAEGVGRAIELLGINPVGGKRVLVKPNFNSADPAPASTHPDVLRITIRKVKEMGAAQITVGDRSGMDSARRVMETIGGFAMAEELGFDFMDFSELGRDDWVMIVPPDTVWTSDIYPLGPGFPFARPVLEAEAVVSLCCLKTHANDGVITMSLKNSVGMVATRLPGDVHPYNYMIHMLHDGNTQAKIAEINLAYQPALIVLDAVEAFTSGGPDVGNLVSPGVVMAGTDRVAIDALGVAILKMRGANLARISRVYQIRNAMRLGLGVDSPEKIHILTDDEKSARFAQRLRGYVMEQWT